MLRRNLLAATVALALSPFAALASDAPAGSPILEIDVAGEANGTIRIALRPDLAPRACGPDHRTGENRAPMTTWCSTA